MTGVETATHEVVLWAKAVEAMVLERGRPLAGVECDDAKAMGVRESENVRVLETEVWSFPESLMNLMGIEGCTNPSMSIAATLGRAIIVRKNLFGALRLVLRHELAHVEQYERMGGIEPYLKEYFEQCRSFGYHAAPLEREAVAKAAGCRWNKIPEQSRKSV